MSHCKCIIILQYETFIVYGIIKCLFMSGHGTQGMLSNETIKESEVRSLSQQSMCQEPSVLQPVMGCVQTNGTAQTHCAHCRREPTDVLITAYLNCFLSTINLTINKTAVQNSNIFSCSRKITEWCSGLYKVFRIVDLLLLLRLAVADANYLLPPLSSSTAVSFFFFLL